MHTFLFFLPVIVLAVVVIALLLKRQKEVAIDQEASVRAAAHIAAVIITAWLMPHRRHILFAEIEPEEGIRLQLETESMPPESCQHLLIVAIAGIAGEAYAFQGKVRSHAARYAWEAADQVARRLVADGHAMLPWIDRAMNAGGQFVIPPPDTTASMATLPLIHASMVRASEIIAANEAAFDRLIDLLLTKKRLEQVELDQFLGIMVPVPPQAP